MKAELVGQLNTKAHSDSFDCCITGLVMISPTILAIADYYNNCVKILDIRRNKITQTHNLTGAPWDVTDIDSVTVAVTLPDKGQIVFVTTSKSQPHRDSLEIRKHCWGIHHRNGIIAVSYSKPSSVQIIDISGSILHNFCIPDMFNSQSYVCLSNDNKSILVSDRENHSVRSLNIDKDEIVAVNCQTLKFPAGLAVLKDGTTVVCSIGNSDMVMLIMPGTKETVPLPVTNVHKPCCVSVCEENNRMYISEDTSSVDRNCIKIYDI